VRVLPDRFQQAVAAAREPGGVDTQGIEVVLLGRFEEQAPRTLAVTIAREVGDGLHLLFGDLVLADNDERPGLGGRVVFRDTEPFLFAALAGSGKNRKR
jgi:hypothetical protein